MQRCSSSNFHEHRQQVMDSQNPFFLDILQDKEQGFESFDSGILMSTPHLGVNVHQSPPEVEMGQSTPPIAKKSTTKRSQRGANFTVDEDIKLVSEPLLQQLAHW